MTTTPPGDQRPDSRGQLLPAGPALDAAAWRHIVAQIGSETAQPLSAALERVNTLATTGQIDRDGLRALRAEIERARDVAIASQQLVRFTSRRIRQMPEAVDMRAMMAEALAHRAREAAARKIAIAQAFEPLTLDIDPALLYALLQSLLGWAIARAAQRIECRIDTDPATGMSRFVLRTAKPDALPWPEDGISWRLVEHIAARLLLPLQRDERPHAVSVVLIFPRTLAEQLDALAPPESDTSFGASASAQPLAGAHVLVIASRRETRLLIRDAVKPMGLVVDFVQTIAEADEFCRGGLPNAIIIESVLAGHRFEELRQSIVSEVPGFVIISIEEEGRGLELRAQSGRDRTLLGRDAVLESLPTALYFELAGPL